MSHVTDLQEIESGNGKIKSVQLISNKGEVLIEKTVNSERVELDVSQVCASFYILKIITGDGVYTSKLLILN